MNSSSPLRSPEKDCEEEEEEFVFFYLVYQGASLQGKSSTHLVLFGHRRSQPLEKDHKFQFLSAPKCGVNEKNDRPGDDGTLRSV